VHGCGDEARKTARSATQEKAKSMGNGVLLKDKDKKLRPDERRHLESKLHKAVEKKVEARTAKGPSKS
jgi:hypothetical protein